eukprot:m.217979 g.217979  ORF g.217979 m.217979 type:complete len:218 (+) comp26251_c1_seq35:1185-1838(+)
MSALCCGNAFLTTLFRSFSSSASRLMASPKPLVVFVLGGPGSGKGTQCARIVEKYGFTHLSAGDLLRAERATGSEVAGLINNYIKEGKIVPVKITVGLIDKAMEASPTKKFLIDGFPRNADNLQGWEDIMGEKVDLRFVLFLDASVETCEKRVLERGKTSGRRDDNAETMKKRIRTYEVETKPILQQFDQRGLLRRVDAEPPVDEVSKDVYDLFDAL